MNANAEIGSESGVELGFGRYVRVAIDGVAVGGVESEGFMIERVVTDLQEVKLVVLSRDVTNIEEDDEDTEFIVIRCEGDDLRITVDQSIYILPGAIEKTPPAPDAIDWTQLF